MKTSTIKPSHINLEKIWTEGKPQPNDPAKFSASQKRIEQEFLNKPKAERVRILKDDCKNKPQYFYQYISHPFISDDEKVVNKKKNNIESILLKNQLYLNSHTNFNDPFDVYPHYTKKCTIQDIRRYVIDSTKLIDNISKPNDSYVSNLTHKISTGKEEFTEKLISNLRETSINTGILCATTNANNILMWSHYANFHQGICIEFDNTEDLNIATLFQKVQYVKNNARPTVNPYKFSNPEDYDHHNLQKSCVWEYEDEWRIALYNRKGTFIEFRPTFISKVILGVKASQETVKYIHRINEERQANSLPPFEIRQAYMADHEFKILH